jgi:SHS2 domain-containing protein
MPFCYRDDLTVADIGFEAQGETLEELFRAAWQATLQVMIETPEMLENAESRTIELQEPELELLLHGFLQELLYFKDAEGLLLNMETCRIEEQRGKRPRWRLHARASGQRAQDGLHALGTDVKAVTFHRFAVLRTEAGWKATVVLDV